MCGLLGIIGQRNAGDYWPEECREPVGHIDQISIGYHWSETCSGLLSSRANGNNWPGGVGLMVYWSEYDWG